MLLIIIGICVLGAVLCLVTSFGAMGGGCNLLSSGVTKVKKGLDILKSHPIIAIIAVVVTIIIKIVEAMKRNEEAVNKFNKALAPLKAIVDVIMKAFDALVSMIADAFAWLMDLIDPLLKLLGIESEVLKTE
jgi:hypothetical protein